MTAGGTRSATIPACSKRSFLSTSAPSKRTEACEYTRLAKLTMTLDIPLSMGFFTSRSRAVDRRSPASLSSEINSASKSSILLLAASSLMPCRRVSPRSVRLMPSMSTTHEVRRSIKRSPTNPIKRIRKIRRPSVMTRLHTYVLRLEVASNEGLTDGAITMQPVLTCPDGKTARPERTESLLRMRLAGTVSNFSVFGECDAEPEAPAFGESATLEDFDWTRRISPHFLHRHLYTLFDRAVNTSISSIDSMPSQCQEKDEKIECALDTLDVDKKSEFSIDFTMTHSVAIPVPSDVHAVSRGGRRAI